MAQRAKRWAQSKAQSSGKGSQCPVRSRPAPIGSERKEGVTRNKHHPEFRVMKPERFRLRLDWLRLGKGGSREKLLAWENKEGKGVGRWGEMLCGPVWISVGINPL